MIKSKRYRNAVFPAETIQDLAKAFRSISQGAELSKLVQIGRGSEIWHFDSEEEFFSEYRQGFDFARFGFRGTDTHDCDFISYDEPPVHIATELEVEAPTRPEIEGVFDVLEREYEKAKRPPPPAPPQRVFIGHGRSPAWRDLKDHLHDKHGYDVVAYEVGARAGHTIRDILDDMLDASSFALLVMTAEDETAEGAVRARQNVVHEMGLFQGRLGFARAVTLVEEGVELFTNIEGIQRIPFEKGAIKSTFGDVLAVLRREFEKSQSLK